MISYLSDRDFFFEQTGLNIWYWLIGLPVGYIIQWILVVWVAEKNPKEILKQKFLKHPIITIILSILYVTDLPYRLSECGGGFVTIFETTVYYAIISLLWWLFACWLSGKIIKNRRLQWRWYQKVVDYFFIMMPITYKIVVGAIVAVVLFYIVFTILTVVFNYTGQDLKILFS